MVMRPRHALAAVAMLTAVTLGSWAALSTDSPKPTPQAAAPIAAPPATPTTTKPRVPHVTKPDVPEAPRPGPCLDGPADLPRRPGKLSRIAGDFDGDHARDQLLAYAELNTAGQPSQWHVRVVAATGQIADLAVDNTGDWIGPNGLVARRAVDANGDGRDEGFVTSTGGASNDTYNLFGLAGCQVRQVRVAGSWPVAVRGRRVGWACRRLRLPEHRPARPTPAHSLDRRAGRPATRRRLRLHLHQDQLPLGRQHPGPPGGHRPRRVRHRGRWPSRGDQRPGPRPSACRVHHPVWWRLLVAGSLPDVQKAAATW